MSLELQMVIADISGDDALTCSIIPSSMFGLPETESTEITDEIIAALAEFNLVMVAQNIVAVPSTIEGTTGILIIKLNTVLDEQARCLFEMFAEPIREGILAERLCAQALLTLLDAKV